MEALLIITAFELVVEPEEGSGRPDMSECNINFFEVVQPSVEKGVLFISGVFSAYETFNRLEGCAGTKIFYYNIYSDRRLC